MSVVSFRKLMGILAMFLMTELWVQNVQSLAFSSVKRDTERSVTFSSFSLSRVAQNDDENSCRREFLNRSIITSMGIVLSGVPGYARADDGETSYANPNIPPGPEERSGLVVLRVAEVAQFQEKILRAVVNGDIDAVVSPQQIAFGTQIMMRNSNLDGNMKLMIYNEIPRRKRKNAIEKAVNTMNTLQDIVAKATRIDHPFTNMEMLEIADMYRYARLELNEMYEYLEPKEKDKYYGYFMKVTEYEKKIAEGTYNPELDGVLKFD